jgi:hypothetical protein
MKRIALLLLAACCCQFTATAQFKIIAQGQEFEEPESGFSKIVQFKDGSTVFFHITFKDGIDLRIYDAKHKEKVVKHIDPAYGKLKSGSIDGIFEINGDATMLISEVDGKIPVLYRLIVDGKTGNLKKEEKIGELKKLSMGQGYAMAFGGVPAPDFAVRKDPNSENYAVAMFNSFEADRNKRIEVIYYGSDHKEISRAYYASPENKYKYMQYIDMTVIGKEKVCVLAYAYNTASSGGKESELVLANVEAGSKEVTLHELNFLKDMIVTGGIARYNPVTKKVVLLAAARAGKKGGYAAFIANVDPVEHQLESVVPAYPTRANEKSIELFGKKHGFTGMPQNLFINNDGSYTVVFEEMTVISSNRSIETDLDNIAVAIYDTDGREVTSYLIPKRHRLMNVYLHSFYHSEREGSAQYLLQGNQFKSFAYLNGNTKSYLLFNDIEENGESVLKGKLTSIFGVSACDGFYFTVAGNEPMPTRQFVFGKPEGRRDHNFALFTISDYNRNTNVYVTLKLAKEGGKKGVQVVWMQPG